MSELENLSIIIVTWKGDELLAQCLDSLAATCRDVPEIVLVDNANLASTREIAAQFRNVTYVATEKNLGFAGGNNVGLRCCHREFVALLNNDTIVRKEPFTDLVKYLQTHERVGVVQGTMTMPLREGRPDACGIFVTRMGGAFEWSYRSMDHTNVTRVASVYAAKGALMVFRRDFPEKVGGLFHDFYFNNFEDVDFGARSCLAGYEVHYVPTHPIEHFCGQSVSRLDHGAVQQQLLYNALFTWLTVLSPIYAVRSVFCWSFWYLMAGVGHWLLTRNANWIHGCVAAITCLWRDRMRILCVRRSVQALRTVSDSEIFHRVALRKSPRYYWVSLRGGIQFEG